MSTYPTPASPAGLAQSTVRSEASSPARQAQRILHVGYSVLPIVAGLDKFFHLLTNWDQYLAPAVSSMLGGRGHEFMLAVGVIEIVAGIGVALKPRLFAWVVAGWLGGIIVNLLLVPGFFDIALRDFGLMLGAIALARLSADDTVR
jgi:hypothetical protein